MLCFALQACCSDGSLSACQICHVGWGPERGLSVRYLPNVWDRTCRLGQVDVICGEQVDGGLPFLPDLEMFAEKPNFCGSAAGWPLVTAGQCPSLQALWPFASQLGHWHHSLSTLFT